MSHEACGSLLVRQEYDWEESASGLGNLEQKEK